MLKSVLFFYSIDPKNLDPNGVYLIGSKNRIEKLIDSFDSKKITILYVPRNLVTGWRTILTSKDVEIIFIGSFTLNEQAQAKARLTRST